MIVCITYSLIPDARTSPCCTSTVLDSIIVGMDLLITKVGKRKLEKRIMLITDASARYLPPLPS